jgi:hypothetical protein
VACVVAGTVHLEEQTMRNHVLYATIAAAIKFGAGQARLNVRSRRPAIQIGANDRRDGKERERSGSGRWVIA